MGANIAARGPIAICASPARRRRHSCAFSLGVRRLWSTAIWPAKRSANRPITWGVSDTSGISTIAPRQRSSAAR